MLAQACADGDARAVFPALDERARHALDSIVTARVAARKLVEQSYPPEARAEALAQLGDARNVRDGAALFALRCGADCMAPLCSGVGAPEASQLDAGLTYVRTVRGGNYVLYRGSEGRYGLLYHAEALAVFPASRVMEELPAMPTVEPKRAARR
jgi:hypothetical protein